MYTGKPTTYGAPQQIASYTMVTYKNLHKIFHNEKLTTCSSDAESKYMHIPRKKAETKKYKNQEQKLSCHLLHDVPYYL